MLFGEVLEDPYYGGIERFERNYLQCLENTKMLTGAIVFMESLSLSGHNGLFLKNN